LNKSHSALNLAQINDKRQRLLYDGKAVLSRGAERPRRARCRGNDVRSSEVALEAARNRLRILGKTDLEITEFQEKGRSTRQPRSTSMPGRSCSARSDGQYVGTARAIGLHHRILPWLHIVVAISARPKRQRSISGRRSIHGPGLSGAAPFPPHLLCRGGARSDHAAAPVPPTVTIRPAAQPEMFASVKILTVKRHRGRGSRDASSTKAHCRVWLVRDDDKAIELRRVKVGLTSGTCRGDGSSRPPTA